MITEAKTPSLRTAPRRGAARFVKAVAAVAGLGLIAAACGSSTPSATTSTTTTAASPAGTTGTTATTGAAGQVVADAVSNAKIGSPILVDSAGKTLYKFSPDTKTTSACTGSCATYWPPLTAAAGTTPTGGPGTGGTFGTITRSDGTLQVTYDGRPLYTFMGDSSSGSTSGQNLTTYGGTWTVVTVGATTTPAATTPPTTTPPTTKAPSTTKPSSGGYGY